ncbi:MAG: hypothetical protein A2X84_08750 [Desulfuromonadaceae bacterium GWC2_58_13]|nr:MAG: hypothetical protein A2X84_08750 [Desulfuromonadaceae bacterium GWC2_58_13]
MTVTISSVLQRLKIFQGKGFRRFPNAALLLLVFVFIAFGCRQLVDKKPNPSPAAAAEVFETQCGKCHDLNRALNKNRSEEAWFATISRMKEQWGAAISREEIDRLVQYHLQRQQTALEKNLQGIVAAFRKSQPELDRGVELFVEKCSDCHDPTRALTVFKPPELWSQTVKRMQYYSKGAITDLEARELVDFHVTRQQQELDAFQGTCSRCHDQERINNRSLSEQQWLETIKRMQQKAPDFISDEKVNLIAAYFHRRELSLAQIFYGKCRLCHFFDSDETIHQGDPQLLNRLIVLADKDFGETLEIRDVNNLLSVHVQRQQRGMQLFANDCGPCHSKEKSAESGHGRERIDKSERSERISLIATLQGVELTKETQDVINIQIDVHVSRQQASGGKF